MLKRHEFEIVNALEDIFRTSLDERSITVAKAAYHLIYSMDAEREESQKKVFTPTSEGWYWWLHRETGKPQWAMVHVYSHPGADISGRPFVFIPPWSKEEEDCQPGAWIKAKEPPTPER